MIYVFGLHVGLNTFRAYRALPETGLDGVRVYENFEPIPYHHVLREGGHRFFDGPHILTDLYVLDRYQIERLAAVFRRLRDSPLDVHLLNDPLTFPGRYELLRRLHEDGINDHNVYHLTERRTPVRWPVFVRTETGHWHSNLLRDAAELEAFLDSMDRRGVWRGNKLVVEFNDTRRADGYYRRDSAFRIGPSIVPWRPNIARNWWLRRDDLEPADYPEEEAEVAEQLDYLRTNPHEVELMAIFERLDIQFGRIDYAMKDGRIQVWEINVSPSLPTPKMYRTTAAGRRVLNLGCERLFDAFAALDSGSRP